MYVTMHIKKILTKKVRTCPFGALQNSFALAYVLQFADAGEMQSVKLCTCEREQCTKYDPTSGLCFDWPIIMIRPDVLLLVAYVLQFAEAGAMQCQ
jgi:hypothetical protein